MTRAKLISRSRIIFLIMHILMTFHFGRKNPLHLFDPDFTFLQILVAII